VVKKWRRRIQFRAATSRESESTSIRAIAIFSIFLENSRISCQPVRSSIEGAAASSICSRFVRPSRKDGRAGGFLRRQSTESNLSRWTIIVHKNQQYLGQ